MSNMKLSEIISHLENGGVVKYKYFLGHDIYFNSVDSLLDRANLKELEYFELLKPKKKLYAYAHRTIGCGSKNKYFNVRLYEKEFPDEGIREKIRLPQFDCEVDDVQ